MYNIQNGVLSVVRLSFTIICIHMSYKCLAYESKMTYFYLIVGSSVGCPLSCTLFPYLKVVGCQLSYPLSWPPYPYMEIVGSLICMAKFPRAAHEQRSGQLPCISFSRMGTQFQPDIWKQSRGKYGKLVWKNDGQQSNSWKKINHHKSTCNM